MVYIEKTGTVTAVGKTRTEFPNGAKVTVKSFRNGGSVDVPGVNFSVKFDFDSENWYGANMTQEDMTKFIAVGKQINIKTWSKESNGKTYHNFAISYPKKPDAAAIEGKLNPLIQSVERQGKQIMSLYAEIEKIKAQLSKKDTTTMFDDDAKDVHPDQYAELYGESQEEPPLSAYDDPSQMEF